MAKVGRPTKYDPSRNQEVIELMSKGASIVEVACLLEISRETIYDWIDKESPRFCEEFSDTIKEGVINSQAWWEQQGRLNLKNKDFSPTLWFMNVKNRFSKDWSDKKQIEHSGDEDKPLNFKAVVFQSQTESKTGEGG